MATYRPADAGAVAASRPAEAQDRKWNIIACTLHLGLDLVMQVDSLTCKGARSCMCK